jgi:hypothetical protein
VQQLTDLLSVDNHNPIQRLLQFYYLSLPLSSLPDLSDKPVLVFSCILSPVLYVFASQSCIINFKIFYVFSVVFSVLFNG